MVCATVCLTVMPSFSFLRLWVVRCTGALQICLLTYLHNRRFNYQPQFQDLQKPRPLNSRHAIQRRHYSPRIKSQKTTRSVNMLNHVTTTSVLSTTSALQSPKMSPRWSLSQWSAVALNKQILFIGASISVLHKLERIQNTLARVVTRQHGRSSISAILHNRHWLPSANQMENRFQSCYTNI